MVDFSKLIKPHIVTNDAGEQVDIKDVPERSIQSIPAMQSALAKPLVENAREIRALDDKMLLTALVTQTNDLIEENFDEDCLRWDLSYSKGLIYYVFSIYKRYPKVFAKHGINTTPSLAQQMAIHSQKREENPVLRFKGQDYTSPQDIKQIAERLTSFDTIRANSAAFKLMLDHYTDDYFIERTEYNIGQCVYGSDGNHPYLILAFLNRFAKN